MAHQITLAHLRDAYRAKDPEFVDLLVQLVTQSDPRTAPPREGAYTFSQFLKDQRSIKFRRKSRDEQAQFRMERLAVLEAVDADPQLPDRLRCHEVIMPLWEADDLYSRRCLLRVIAEVPLVYGPFKALKQILKLAEAKDDTEVLGALAARFDMAFSERTHQVSHQTLGYLVRRGWRYLRRIGETFPATYADVATDYLVHYRGRSAFLKSWILNHVFFHEMQVHARSGFRLGNYEYGKTKKRPTSWQKYRAFDELWRRTPRPLFTLLEQAQAEVIVAYAVNALKTDFRGELREVEASWVVKLIGARSRAIDSFVVWLLSNVPRFEQSKFRELGLHDAVLQLFESQAPNAQDFAATYTRTHARDLPVDHLIQLANSRRPNVRKLAVDLLLSRDARKEIGLDNWGKLLATELGHSVAVDALRKHFGAAELTPAWFADLLVKSPGRPAQFAAQRLPEVHPVKELGWAYFVDVLERLTADWENHQTGRFCCEQLQKLGPKTLPQEQLQRLLLHPLSGAQITDWVENGQLGAAAIGSDFLKIVAYRPSFEESPQIAELQRTAWGRDSLQFDDHVAGAVLEMLKDVRQFSPDDLGFEWLLELVQRSESLYHNFAVEVMTKAFLPADFAPTESVEPDAPADAPVEPSEINVDLGGASFVFTGKLNTMTRGEAQKKVTDAKGANSNSVTKKLDYLVIGDDGSPLYGQGRKGSKQLKGEKLNDDGAEIRIISETAFLQMLAGEQREFSDDAIQEGCERLWSMMCDSEHPDAPLARFARTYLRRHHPDICLAETDRPVDPGAEIPDDFLTFERVLPLFGDNRETLRQFALEYARWEFARWQPPIGGIVEMCDAPYAEVREFVALAVTADESPEHRRYRIDPNILTADAVYSFCESANRQTRALGMDLINRHPRLQVPDELFRLTESPDGNVRTFVIRTFWSLYRNRGISRDWKPAAPPATTKKKSASKKSTAEGRGEGAPPRPEALPAGFDELQSLLRRILFEIPPGRPPKNDEATDETSKLRPLPARQAKLKLVETLRDLAIEDSEFATYVLPILREFKNSKGKSEQAACLVAVTRIEHHVLRPEGATT